jgi:hypothetical protein
VLDRDNTASDVWADTAYRSVANRTPPPEAAFSGLVEWSRLDFSRLPDDPAALKAIILAQREERLTASARAYEALVQALKIRIARLQRRLSIATLVTCIL